VSAFVHAAKTPVAAVFEAADAGLYEAKETGRNRVVVKKVAG
jgi:PleD family two-component response regulator